MKSGEVYQDQLGNRLTIIKVEKLKVYYASSTKIGGLIDNVGRYFLLGSVYHTELKKVTGIKDVTPVIFRKEKNDEICAFFPYQIADTRGSITCYSHIGQHSAAALEYYYKTKPCSLIEAQDLVNELLFIGYNLHVQKKICHNHYIEAYRNSDNW